MAQKRITANDAITYASVNTTDVLLIAQTAVDKKITMPQVKKYCLQNKTIGTTTAGSIVTNNGSQVLTNKDLTEPDITGGTITQATLYDPVLSGLTLNGSSVDTITGADIDRVCSTVATTAQLDKLDNCTQNIQTSLNGKVNRYNTGEYYAINYSARKTTGATTQVEIAASSIMTTLGLAATYYVIPTTVNISIYIENSGDMVQVWPTTTIRVSAGKLDTIRFTGLTLASTYYVSITFLLGNSA